MATNISQPARSGSQSASSQIECRTFQQPDDKLDFAEHGKIDIVRLRDGTTGMHAVFEPGWTWSADEKPLLGDPDACPMAHIGYCIAGELIVRMVATKEEKRIRRGDFFEIPAGHDGYVPGSQRCEMILFAAPEHPGA
jgi:hypothetical protein